MSPNSPRALRRHLARDGVNKRSFDKLPVTAVVLNGVGGTNRCVEGKTLGQAEAGIVWSAPHGRSESGADLP